MSQVLSVQSAVAYGYAGNSAAAFTLQRMGVEVWPVYTVNFSNNTSYGSWRGPVMAANQVLDVVKGVQERGVFAETDAILTGYMGAAEIGEAIESAVDLVRADNPDAIYCCDPVFGDVGRGFYAPQEIAEFFRERLIPKASIISPNLFELEFLVGRPVRNVQEVLEAANELADKGPGTVLATSVLDPQADEKSDQPMIRMVAFTKDEAWQVSTPLIDRRYEGSGDFTSATFLAQILGGKNLGDALSATASIVYSVLKLTAERESPELCLIQGQDFMVDPKYRFEAIKIS